MAWGTGASEGEEVGEHDVTASLCVAGAPGTECGRQWDHMWKEHGAMGGWRPGCGQALETRVSQTPPSRACVALGGPFMETRKHLVGTRTFHLFQESEGLDVETDRGPCLPLPRPRCPLTRSRGCQDHACASTPGRMRAPPGSSEAEARGSCPPSPPPLHPRQRTAVCGRRPAGKVARVTTVQVSPAPCA